MTELNNIKNEVIAQNPKAKAFNNALAKAQETYINLVSDSIHNMNLELSEYQKVCGMNIISRMKELADKEGLQLSKMNQTNLMNILQTATMLNLNISATPRECYLITRNAKSKDGTWTKEFEFGIEGDGNDKLLRTFGVDIKKVYPHWQVREGDGFTYPAFKGIEIEPPTWIPKSYTGKIVRVVYPIEYNDGSMQYHISEREEVKVNLLAHINNNLMKNKDYTEEKKYELISRISNLSFEKIFDDKEAVKIMSPSWSSVHSRESMILRKMRNNCTKKIPKDFQNAFVSSSYEKTYEDYEQYNHDNEEINKEDILEAEVTQNIASETIEIDADTGEVIETSTIKETKQVNERPF